MGLSAQALLAKFKSLEANMRRGVPQEERIDIDFVYGDDIRVSGAAPVDTDGDGEMKGNGISVPRDAAAAAAQSQALIDAAVGHLHTLLDVCIECNLAAEQCHALKAHLPPPGASVQALVEVRYPFAEPRPECSCTCTLMPLLMEYTCPCTAGTQSLHLGRLECASGVQTV